MTSPYRLLSIVLVVIFAHTSFTQTVSASEGASPANCVFVVGDGKSGDNATIHEIVYPNDKNYTVDGGEDSWFVNCNARNFLVNDGSEYHLDGNRIGDRFKTLEATTPSGVKVRISLGIYWTLNQNDAAMREFWSICLKYQCASPEAFDPNAVNFSNPGWNGFLAENFSYALWSAARTASEFLTDDIWDKESKAQFDLLAGKISENFAAELRYALGFQNDIVCGSNTSQWQDPNSPGDPGNAFICQPVRVKIHDITLAPFADQGPSGQKILTQIERDNAEILYGENTDEVLGDLDRIKACVSAGSYCSITIWPDASEEAVEPSVTPTPTPEQGG